MQSNRFHLAAALIALTVGATAQAQDVGQHPAVFAARQLPGVDPSTFIVGHPASPTVRGGHANSPHPAELTARATPVAVDPNTYLVQPPVAVRWLANGGAETSIVAQASR